MRNKAIRFTGLWLILIFGLAACAPASETGIEASLGKEVTLSPGQAVTLTGEDLSLIFKSVTADSRCPQGVTCVWAGEAGCRVVVTLQGAASETVLKTGGGTAGWTRSVFDIYTLYFSLSPYPEAGKTIASQDYRLHLKVLKEPPV
jgi:hypothetical protein